MALSSSHSAPLSDGPATGLAPPPPLRLLQPWVPVSLRTTPAGLASTAAVGGAAPRAWHRRLLALLQPRGAAR